jgi:hypothetical protein
VDNRFFPNRSAHLQVRQPCAPIPLAVVTGTGTKHGACLFLWITTWLCQNYPQSYAPALVHHEFVQKNDYSAYCISAISYFIDSKHELQEPCSKCRSTSTSAKRCPKTEVRTQVLFMPPFWGGPPERACTGNGVSRGSGYSSIALYINSSSSKASRFLWTRPICSMLARGCAAAKSVWRSAQRAGLADNNFGPSTFCVDNCPVVPELFPVLSTTGAHRQPFPSHKAQSPGVRGGLRALSGKKKGEPPPTSEPPPASGRPHEGIYFAGAACGC